MQRKKNFKMSLLWKPDVAIAIATIFFICVAIPGRALAQDGHDGATSYADTMSRANTLYEREAYEEAARLYQDLVDQGVSDSVLFYNLGNAHYNAGNMGSAIINYERALQLTPRDSDIAHNLELAQRQLENVAMVDNASFLQRTASFSGEWLTADEVAILALCFWVLFTILFLFYRRTPRGLAREGVQYGLLVIGIFLALVMFVLVGSMLSNQQNLGTVVVVQTELHNAPGVQTEVTSQLYAGEQVEILETHTDWVLIGAQGGTVRGWVPRDTVDAFHVNKME